MNFFFNLSSLQSLHSGLHTILLTTYGGQINVAKKKIKSEFPPKFLTFN